MNFRLWVRILCSQLLISFLLVSVILGLMVWQIPHFEFQQLFDLNVWDVCLFLWMIALITTFSVLYSIYLTLSLNDFYEMIRAKINWLLLGKYHHSVFAQEAPKNSWYANDSVLSEDIDQLRKRMVELTEDLQEFTAAPVFVGEETKEEIVEHERSRIARELHDSVSQQLFASMMMLSAITEGFPPSDNPKLASQLHKVESVISNAQTEMRALLLHLRPVDLQGKSLKQGIQNLLLELQAKISLELTWDLDDPKLETGIEDHLFRIIQEAVSNTMRHARANKLDVYLRASKDMVNIRIVDDGKGFDPAQAQQTGSYGLTNIQERVKGMGGSVTIISSPGQGTVINITVPVKPIER